MTRHISYSERRTFELISIVRGALSMSLLMAESIKDDDVRWRQLMNLELIAHECLHQLGIMDSVPDDFAGTRHDLMVRIQAKVLCALASLRTSEDEERARALLAKLAESTDTVQTQLNHFMLWEHEDAHDLTLN